MKEKKVRLYYSGQYTTIVLDGVTVLDLSKGYVDVPEELANELLGYSGNVFSTKKENINERIETNTG